MKGSLVNTLRYLPKRNLLDKLSVSSTTVRNYTLPIMNSSKESSLRTPNVLNGLHSTWKKEKKKMLKRNTLQLALESTIPSNNTGSKSQLRVFPAVALAAAFGFSMLLFKAGKSTAFCANEVEDSKDLIERRSQSDLFFEACKRGDLDTIKRMVEEGFDVNDRHRYGWTPLLVSVANNQYKLVEYLLTQGADPDIHDHYSGVVRRGEDNFFYVEFDLLTSRHELFPHFKDVVCGGFTSLHYAAKLDNIRIIELLYRHGANGLAKNEKGFTSADVALSSSTVQAIKDLQIKREKSQNPELYRKATLSEILHTELIGQRIAIDQVSAVVSRLETKWFNDRHPMVLLFVGDTGLGKTEMAKHLAHYLRGDLKESFVHINLSEYQSKHEAAKFIGAPPGYVGYSSGDESQLLSLLSKNPRAVVLLDEADKAHPDVLATLLQLFDEGRLTSGSGKTLDCPEAVFILTANLGMEEIKKFGEAMSEKKHRAEDKEEQTAAEQETAIKELTSKLLHGKIKEAFKRDELLGRINEVALFFPFTAEERAEIVEKQLNRIRQTAGHKHGISLSWDKNLLDILSNSISEKYGARNIKHEIDRQVVVRLSNAEESDLYKPGDFVHIQVDCLEDDSSCNYVRLYKILPDGSKENLSLRFADLDELYAVNHC